MIHILEMPFVGESTHRLLTEITDEKVVATCTLTNSGTYAELSRLFVSPDHRRHGAGSRMVVCAMREAAALGCKSISCAVHRDNEIGMAFWLRGGFRRFAMLSNGWVLVRPIT